MDKQIRTFSLSKDQVDIDCELALRFLRVRRQPDEQMSAMLKECVREVQNVISYKASYRCFDIRIIDNTVYFDDQLQLESEKLCNCLRGCDKAFVFVATTDVALDRLIAKYRQLLVCKSVVIDAIGSSAIECFCDILCEQLQNEYKVSFRPRYSPGYGDLSILCQGDVLRVCDSTRKIGVTLTDRFMMIPQKSVSAIVGVRPHGEKCEHKTSCERCECRDCEYRK